MDTNKEYIEALQNEWNIKTEVDRLVEAKLYKIIDNIHKFD
jgi:hypothetical protein